MYKLSAWDLTEIIPEDYSKALQEVELKVAFLEAQRKLLTNNISGKEFIGLVQKFEELKTVTSKLSASVFLKFCENSSHQESLALLTHTETFLTKITNRLLFFSLWFKDLPDQKAKELITSSGKNHYYFEQLRKIKPYTLKENEEKIINLKDVTGVSALNNVYNILTSQFKFSFKGKELTQEELVSKVRDHSPAVRKEAYTVLLTKYSYYKDVIGEIYKNLVNDWREENVHLRKYKDPITVRNIANDVPDQAVDSLLKVCEKNEPLFQRFFELKRKHLGLKKFTRFDLYAPLKEEKTKISYPQAVELVLKVFNNFSPVFKDLALQIINHNHVHSKIQKNKQSGAFCSGFSTTVTPYILLNYTETMRDVSTLAHELGHGVHDLLASRQTEFTFYPSLPLAETASIFSEMLLSEELARKNLQRAKELLFFKLDEVYASIIRQAGFVRFELKAHKMIEQGKTMQEISEVYLADLKKQLGRKVEINPLFSYEWCYIPHLFHTPFYCYAYAFGNLLTFALYSKYKKNSQFKTKIIEMLAKGGSESPLEVTKALGVDICSESFWQEGFDVIKEMIKEIEQP